MCEEHRGLPGRGRHTPAGRRPCLASSWGTPSPRGPLLYPLNPTIREDTNGEVSVVSGAYLHVTRVHNLVALANSEIGPALVLS